MSSKTKWTLLGFCLFVLGMSSMIISFVGLQYSFLAWMDVFGAVGGLLLKLAMVFAGVLITLFANYDPSAVDDYLEDKEL